MNDPNHKFFKVIVVGDIGTGKTTFLKRYVHDEFSSKYKSTVGVDFFLKSLNYKGYKITLQLWDIAGQERFGNMTRVFYKNAYGALVLFDVSHERSLEAVSKWKADIDRKVFLEDDRPIPCVLCANKCDLYNTTFKSRPEMQRKCEEDGFIKWFETSSKTYINLEASLFCLLDRMLQVEAEISESKKSAVVVTGKEQTVKLGAADSQRQKQQQQQSRQASGCCD